jgi:hypothetical protein
MIDADSELDLDPETASVPLRDHADDSRRAHERASRFRSGSAVTGPRELYVYWKTHDLQGALLAAARMQSVLCGRIQGLQAELLHRDGAADGRHTVMEVYRHPQGIDGPLQSIISNAAGPAVSTLMASPRVVEAFRPCISGE